jgi:hypothetical protein
VTNEPSLQQPPLQDAPLSSSELIETPTIPGEIDPENPSWLASKALGFVKAILVWIASVACLVFVPLVLIAPYLVYRYVNGSLGREEMAGDKIFIFLSILGVIPAPLNALDCLWAVVSQWGKHPFWEVCGFHGGHRKSRKNNRDQRRTCGLAPRNRRAIELVRWREKTQLDQLINSSYQRASLPFPPLLQDHSSKNWFIAALSTRPSHESLECLGCCPGVDNVRGCSRGTVQEQSRCDCGITLLSLSLTLVRVHIDYCPRSLSISSLTVFNLYI